MVPHAGSIKRLHTFTVTFILLPLLLVRFYRVIRETIFPLWDREEKIEGLATTLYQNHATLARNPPST